MVDYCFKLPIKPEQLQVLFRQTGWDMLPMSLGKMENWEVTKNLNKKNLLDILGRILYYQLKNEVLNQMLIRFDNGIILMDILMSAYKCIFLPLC